LSDGLGDIIVAMKNTKRLILGVISSLLLSAGFAQAAEKIDPLASDIASETTLQVADDCDGTCGIADDLN
jgi:hypothetical protein